MNDQDINLAIANICGWRIVNDLYWGKDGCTQRATLPDYANDLNAMHDAIMGQSQEMRMNINDKLMHLIDSYAPYCLDRTINATAHQRAEALLRTFNLWKE